MTVTLSVHCAWWLRAYLHCVVFTSEVTGLEPDMDKVGRWIDRGVRARVESI